MTMRGSTRLLSAVSGICVVAMAPLTLASSGLSAASTAAAVDTSSPIKHVVVIYQENHTFDDVLGAVCQTRSTPCNGFTGRVTFADGVTAQNKVEPDFVPGVAHSPAAQRQALGNNWDRIRGCASASNYACIAHFERSGIPNLAALADKFGVSDATYAVGDDMSFAAHVELAAGTDAGFYGTNPVTSTTGAAPLAGWGCPSQKDAKWGVGFQPSLTFEPSCIPLPDGSGAYRATRVPYVPTIMEKLERAGLSWHLYEGPKSNSPSPSVWNFCSYIAWCQLNRNNPNTSSSYDDFKTDATNGTLPSVSFLSGEGATSQHNQTSMLRGDNYIGSMVNALMNGPQWNSTAIFVTWDDCGCFYDHVKPPSRLGLRNPMVIVSPWVKPTSTDSTTAIQPYSVLSFIDHNFGLANLTPAVGAAYDYSNSFDFTQTPLTPARMIHSHIAAATKVRVARYLDSHPDDLT
jgi:phospholipase C